MVLATVLLVCLAALPSGVAAAGPAITVHGTGTAARCSTTGRPVASVIQGEAFDLSFKGFPTTSLSLTLTFPDGRIFTPAEADKLDGIKDQVATLAPTPASVALDPVDAALQFTSLVTWPTGCYTIKASSGALSAEASLAVLAKTYNAQPGSLQLSVLAKDTNEPKGKQGVIASIFGRGVPGQPAPTLEIVQPNGAIIALPATAIKVTASNYVAEYTFTPEHRTGVYTVVASTTAAGGASYAVQSQFELTAATFTPAGNAALTMDPFTTLVKRDTVVSIQGRLFAPKQPLKVIVVLASGAQFDITKSGLAANESGNVSFPGLTFSRYIPTGSFTLVVTDSQQKTAVITWRLMA